MDFFVLKAGLDAKSPQVTFGFCNIFAKLWFYLNVFAKLGYHKLLFYKRWNDLALRLYNNAASFNKNLLFL